MHLDHLPKMHKPEEFKRFGAFMALPKEERMLVFGFTTEKQFAEHFKVRPATLSEWKQREDFWSVRDAYLAPFRAHTAQVIEALAKRAERTGDAYQVLTFLKVVEGFSDKGNAFSLKQRKPPFRVEIVHNLDQACAAT
ncbi:MAG TPA: hypothetical protein VHC20_00175 [Candidatus Paceibacterota bacterium]|nr:hypothetical protein [Candidatus Paceibacterota bacterium]